MTKRYIVEEFDGETYIVADTALNQEVCTCGAYDGGELVDGFPGRTPEEARHAAYTIADLLNVADVAV